MPPKIVPKLDFLKLKTSIKEPQTLVNTKKNVIEKLEEEDIYAMSFIDSQKFSPIHSVIDDHSFEA